MTLDRETGKGRWTWVQRETEKRGDEGVREEEIMTRKMSKKCITVPAFSAIEAFLGLLMRTALRTCSLCILRSLTRLVVCFTRFVVNIEMKEGGTVGKEERREKF
jgi:hypothetical protein